MPQEVVANIKAEVVPFISNTITRPSNATAYAIGDSLANVTTDAHWTIDMSKQGYGYAMSGSIVAATLTSSAANTADPKPALGIHLFNNDQTDVADNSAVTWANTVIQDTTNRDHFGPLSFGADSWGVYNVSGGLIQTLGPINVPFVTDTSGQLFAFPILQNAYTPTSAEEFILTLFVAFNEPHLDPKKPLGFLNWGS